MGKGFLVFPCSLRTSGATSKVYRQILEDAITLKFAATYLLHELDKRAGAELWSGVAELLESNETGVGVTEHTVTVSRNDLAALEGLPEEVLDVTVGDLAIEFLQHVQLPAEHFLVGKTGRYMLAPIPCVVTAMLTRAEDQREPGDRQSRRGRGQQGWKPPSLDAKR